MTDSADETRPRRRSRVPLALAAIVAVGFVVAFLLLRDATPLLSSADLESARTRWEALAIDSYTIRLHKEAGGAIDETITTVVDAGRPTSMSIDGRDVNPPRDSYTLPSLFEIMERELVIAEGRESLPGQPQNPVLKAAFDGKTGVPLVFKRIASKRSVFMTVLSVDVPGRGDLVASD